MSRDSATNRSYTFPKAPARDEVLRSGVKKNREKSEFLLGPVSIASTAKKCTPAALR